MIEYVLILLLIAIFLLIFVFETRERKEKKQETEIQEAYERIDSLGGTTYIKQQLKTKSAGKIAEKHNLTLESLNKYCQEHDTTIDKLLNEIPRDYAKERERLRKKQERKIQQQEQERKIQEAFETLNKLGGADYIKQQLKTKSAEEIAQEYNINTKNLNQYCQKQGTSINQLKKEIQKEERQHQKRLEKQRQEREYQRQLRQQHEQATRRIKQQQEKERQKNMRDIHLKEVYSPYNNVNISEDEFNRRQAKLRERALENRRGYGRH